MTPPNEAAASADAKRNAYYVSCKCVGHSRPYAACLHLIDLRKTGRLEVLYADCSGHIGQKRCPALSMRKEELANNKAIYFVERIKSDMTFVNRAKAALATTVNAVREVVASPKALPQPVVTDYAAAINAALKEKSESASTPVVSKPNPGESLLEAARRLLKQKAA